MKHFKNLTKFISNEIFTSFREYIATFWIFKLNPNSENKTPLSRKRKDRKKEREKDRNDCHSYVGIFIFISQSCIGLISFIEIVIICEILWLPSAVAVKKKLNPQEYRTAKNIFSPVMHDELSPHISIQANANKNIFNNLWHI